MVSIRVFLFISALLTINVMGQDPPTLYQYYTEGGISSGLETLTTRQFTLNGKPITLYSGSIHYYRVVPEYWRDRLRRMRSAGLNAIETYVPWNLHEPEIGTFDFGDGGNDFSPLLNITQFLKIAQEEDLFVILRPGPYICTEWDFGGLPSWLLRYPGIKVRTSDPIFTGHVKQFFDQLLAQVVDYQFTRGGSIIAVQIENEYGSFGAANIQTSYLEFIRDTYVEDGISELLFTCDSAVSSGTTGALPGYLMMANFNNNPAEQFDKLLELQPDKPLMSMEFWVGWFDHWWSTHDTGLTTDRLTTNLGIIFSYNASVNFYMFHGGTTFGFLNGANSKGSFPFYEADTSSYDYDAPLSEAGDYTTKFDIIKDMVAQDNQVSTLIPNPPLINAKIAYPTVAITEFLSFEQIIQQIPADLITQIDTVTNMEALEINRGSGQSYGLIVYRKQIDIPPNAELQITGRIRDVAMVLVDGVQKTKRPEGALLLETFGYWTQENPNFTIIDPPAGTNTLDIVVENWARVNFGSPSDFEQKKGLFEGPVSVDGQVLSNLTAIPLEFKSKWVKSLTGWQPVEGAGQLQGPLMVRAKFQIQGTPTDTFLDMSAWSKGCIFVNGFNIGRFFLQGPQVTSYIPAPLLKEGENEIIVFEHYIPGTQIVFTAVPNLGRKKITN
ncbi:Hypothetical predicted protein [Cloeon dipterum]|uniref:Beta-galactosidase n=2 Tax=Cloeon dipterum TaxID=197152 RepID=A0A8S1CQN8_9INSE|nr:Hypothetical predicted protein [Cloeon dipterum]